MEEKNIVIVADIKDIQEIIDKVMRKIIEERFEHIMINVIGKNIEESIKNTIEEERADKKLSKLISPKTVEEEYGIRVKTLAYWRLIGTGPSYTQIGRRVFYDRAIIEKFIKSREIKISNYDQQQ